MQIGIDLGATKIESVLLDENGKEHLREREKSPQNYAKTLTSIKNIVNKIEKIIEVIGYLTAKIDNTNRTKFKPNIFFTT